ncbi:MAG: TetR/AcrR family transcriptional regulator [Spirochaetota bacterium]
MPRGFTEDERVRINEALLEAGERLFSRYGFAKTTVGELAAAVGISKGAFYLFYASKEDLLMALIDRFERETRAGIEATFRSAPTVRDGLRSVVLDQLERAKRNPLIRRLMTGDLARNIWQGSSEAARERSVRNDVDFVRELFGDSGALAVSPEVASGMLRAVALLAVHRDEIGEDVSDVVERELVDAVVNHICGGSDGTD